LSVTVSPVTWDATINKFSGLLGIGIVVQDRKSYVHAAKHMTRLVHLEGDALQVVKAVSSNVRNLSRCGQLVGDTHITLNYIFSWQIHHISIFANKATHDLAYAAVKQFINQVWM
jgi:uncharacterized protein YbbC (DUF1343 family)